MKVTTCEQFTIRPEPAKALSPRVECKILRKAVRQNPRSRVLRLKLAKLLNLLDAFDDTIALFNPIPTEQLGAGELLALAHAHLTSTNPESTEIARRLAERALEVASSDPERSVALSEAAKAYFRKEDSARAVTLLEEALRLDAGNSIACKRLATYWLRQREPEVVLNLAERLAARGVCHSRLLASRMIALVQLGKIAEAHKLFNPNHCVQQQELIVPDGWGDLRAFNSALAQELSVHPGLRFGRYGTASRETWRIDAPATGAVPATRALLARVSETVLALASASPHRATSCAKLQHEARLDSWCVITGGDGFEDWHMHHRGMLSGVYYVEVPDAVCEGDDDSGCMILGVPEGLVGKGAAREFGQRRVRPRRGLLALFPSHAYHRTFPHRSNGHRICISFDLVPA